jgi:hypothetical protein
MFTLRQSALAEMRELLVCMAIARSTGGSSRTLVGITRSSSLRMIDYKTDRGWNLDIARKNLTRAVGYLKRAAKEDELQGVIREACALEQRIMELIEEETND